MKNYENLFLFILQKKEIEEYMDKEDEKTIECYLINNDIVNLYLKNEKISYFFECIDNYKSSKQISNYSDLFNEPHINNIVKSFLSNTFNNDNIKKNLAPIFLLTENMILNGINIPYNFFILEKNYFNRIISNNSDILKDFIEYKVLICKEGIFVYNEKKIDKIIIYYLYPDKLNENKFNKVFIFKKLNDFYKELNSIKDLGRIEYFKSRNIQNINGYYNLNYDGKIIGQYINIYINENFENKFSNDDYYYENNIEDMNEIEDLDKKKVLIIKIFLSNVLTCLSKSKSLKDELIKRNKLFEKFSNNKKYILINKLKDFIMTYNNGNDDKIKEILNDFHNEFKKQNLYSQINKEEENKFIFYENIIKIFLDSLNKEASNFFNVDNLEEKSKNSFIFNIFYGEKMDGNTPRNFNTLFIDPNYYVGNAEHIGINEILHHIKFKEEINVKTFPKILIILIDCQYEDFIIAPLKIEIEYKAKKYNLLSCIQISESNFASIVKKNNYFIKIYWNEENDCEIEKNLEQDKELNNCFVYFYEQEEEKQYIKKPEYDYYNNNFIDNNINNNSNEYNNKKNNMNLNFPYNNIKNNNNFQYYKSDMNINNENIYKINLNSNSLNNNINNSNFAPNYFNNNNLNNFNNYNYFNSVNINSNFINNNNYSNMNNNNINNININSNSLNNNNYLNMYNNNFNNLNINSKSLNNNNNHKSFQ